MDFTFLHLLGLALIGIYFFWYYLIFKQVGKVESKRYFDTFSKDKFKNSLPAFLMASSFFVPNLIIASIIFIVALLGSIFMGIRHSKKIVAHGFPSQFQKAIKASNILAVVGILVLFIAVTLAPEYGT